MEPIFNLLIIAMVALIAYWWSSEGCLSSILHLVCVICAGAIALAVWEPLVYGVVLSTDWYAPFLPGTVLLLVFAIVLAVLRVISDKAAPGNVRLPQALDMIFGGTIGAASGVLTVGLLVLGTGFIQRPLQFMGHTGWARNDQGFIRAPESPLWIPVDEITTGFYEYLSLSTMHPDIGGTPLATFNPHLNRQASLIRDTAHTEKGKVGQTIQTPKSVKIDTPFVWPVEEGGGKYLTIPVTFTRDGIDYQRALLLSSAQVRLVGTRRGKIEVAHPVAWGQNLDKDETRGFFVYDAPTRYASSVGGIAETPIKLVFALKGEFEPDYIQIRGTRFDLPAAEEADSEQEFFSRAWAIGTGSAGTYGGDITGLVDTRGRFDRSVRPLRSDFSGDSEINDDSQLLVRANYCRINKSRNPSRGKLSVRGYHPPQPGTGVIKINVSPGGHADLLSAARDIGGDGELTLEDSEDRSYAPIGYEHVGQGYATVTYNEPITLLSSIRARPRAGTGDKLYLIFALPAGVSPAELYIGDISVGYIEGIIVEEKRIY